MPALMERKRKRPHEAEEPKPPVTHDDDSLFAYEVEVGHGRELHVLSDPVNTWGYCCGNQLWSAGLGT